MRASDNNQGVNKLRPYFRYFINLSCQGLAASDLGFRRKFKGL